MVTLSEIIPVQTLDTATSILQIFRIAELESRLKSERLQRIVNEGDDIFKNILREAFTADDEGAHVERPEGVDGH